MNPSKTSHALLIAALLSLGAAACGAAPDGTPQGTHDEAAPSAAQPDMTELRSMADQLMTDMKADPALAKRYADDPWRVLYERGVSPDVQEVLFHQVTPEDKCKVTCTNSCRRSCNGATCTYTNPS